MLYIQKCNSVAVVAVAVITVRFVVIALTRIQGCVTNSHGAECKDCKGGSIVLAALQGLCNIMKTIQYNEKLYFL